MNLSDSLANLSLNESSNASKFQCGQCNKPIDIEKASKCGKCRLVRYCSKECQTTAWKTHKQICKEPEQVTYIQVDGDAIERITTNVWDEKQISAGKKPKKKTTIIDPASLGFKKNKTDMGTLLNDERYNEIRLHFDTDAITPSKMNWLRMSAEKGHVPLMLHLALILTGQAKTDKSKTEEAFRWIHLSSHCIQLDITCCMDQVVIEDRLNFIKNLEKAFKSSLPQEEFEKYFAKEYIHKIVSSWTPKENHPSPKWLMSFTSPMVAKGINALKPQKDWYRLRLEKHKELTEGKSSGKSSS